MLTGKDQLSLSVLAAFKDHIKLQNVAEQFNLSLDQIKRLKRYYNYKNWISENLGEVHGERFTTLGLKGLVLAPLVNEAGSDALVDILFVTDANTKRDELITYIRLYKEKMDRVQEFQKKHESYLFETEKQLVELNKQLRVINRKRKKIMANYKFKNKYSPELSDLLLFYLAVLPSGYALRHRLHDGFKTRLRKLKVIEMNDEYVWEVKDIDSFVIEMERRLEKGYKYKYNGDEYERYWAVYKYTEHEEFIEQEYKDTKEKIEKIKTKQRENEKNWKQAMKQPFQTYEESSIKSDYLSEKELLIHRNMQNKAMKWLYNKGYVGCVEVTLPNGRRADVIGYKGDKIIIIEVKASRADFKQDTKWGEYLPYCHEFYFFLNFRLFSPDDQINASLLYQSEREIVIEKELPNPVVNLDPVEIEELKYLIARTLTKKGVFGW